MKIKIDASKCIGCGLCVSIADSFFVMDNGGKAKVIKQPEKEDKDVINAIESCPVEAISREDK
jgi:ferredoxin